MCWNEERNACSLIRTTLILLYTYIVVANARCSNNQYILVWTNPRHFTHPFIQKGNKSFVINQCRHQNCFISYRHINVTKNFTHYDAVLFNAVTLRLKPSIQLPRRPANDQKYILVSGKSAGDFPLTHKYNDFFHWTWTYKLNSDISNAYIAIKDKDGKVIGPKQVMNWMTTKEMKKFKTAIISKLQFKTTAAAWIITNCNKKSQYETYIQKFMTELEKFNHTLDIFGSCGNKNCPEDNIVKCYKLLERKYYFYLSFEDSLAEDYVTDELLKALNNFAVPLVFGGANYTRFMPEGIYLNALELGPTKLAKQMNDIIGNRKAYYDMFKWHNYYSFHNPDDNSDTNGICELCNLLNNKQERAETTKYENIVTWFNDRKDWNLEDKNEEIKIKHIMDNKNLNDSDEHSSYRGKKQYNKKTPIHIQRNNLEHIFDKPESQDLKINLETENPSLENLYNNEKNYLLQPNKQKTSLVFDKPYEDNKDDFAKIGHIRNIIKNDLYNDVGLLASFLESLVLRDETEKGTSPGYSNVQNDNIQYHMKKDSLLDLITRLEKEDLTSAENNHTTGIYNTQNFNFNDYQRLFDVESTTNKQQQPTSNEILIQQTTKEQPHATTKQQQTTMKQQQTTTMKQQQTTTMKQQQTTTTKQYNIGDVVEQLKKENKILKDALKHFEEIITLNKQQLSIRNIFNISQTETIPFISFINDKDSHDSFSEKPHIRTAGNNNNKKQKLDLNFKNNLNNIIKREEEESTNTSTKAKEDTSQINQDIVFDGNQKTSTTQIQEQKNQNDEETKSGPFNVLIWTDSKMGIFNPTKMGKTLFTENKCEYQNCILSNEYSNITDLTNYEAVIFNAAALREQPYIELPQQRDKQQKYVLVSRVSAANFPITTKYNNFFNWTWTYKLDSDINFSYIVIKNKDGKIVGPAKDMHWIPLAEMDETNEQIIKKLQNKTTAAAWIMPDCTTINKYEYYITDFRNELRKFDHVLNVFGQCGNMKCLNDDCYTLLETEYYFYLSFEDSIAEDYVTGQLLTALNHFVVPVVFGGANYTRFMPDGIYLDALELGPVILARKISDIIRNRKSYNDMFRWHNYYSYYNPLDHPDTSGICTFCALLNDKQKRKEITVYKNIIKWFNDRKDWNIKQETTTNVVEGRKYAFKTIRIAENQRNNYTTTTQSRSTKDIYNNDDVIILDSAKATDDFTLPTHGLLEKRMNSYRTKSELSYSDELIEDSNYEQTTKSIKIKDTSIRCPNIATCISTILSNVSGKLISLFV